MKKELFVFPEISTLLTIINTIIFIIFTIGFNYFNNSSINIFLLIFIIIIYFFLSFFINVLIINRSVGVKIDRIYRIIEKSGNIKLKHRKNSIFEIEKEIGNWAELKSTEINQLKVMVSYRKEYLGNVSHELKTPIFIAQSYIETLLDGSINDDRVNRKHLKKSLKSILRLSNIVKDLEMISKLERDRLVLEKKDFDVNLMIKDIIDSIDISAKNYDIKVIMNKIDQPPLMVYADEEKIEQVISNLITNAIKYNKEENGKISINCIDKGDKYMIEVQDNGIGIKKEVIGRIFERFYRVDTDRSRKKGGTGLGLAIVKHILEAHGEKIYVESEYGSGSKFYFTLEKSYKNKSA